ncbi:MAG: endonuclease MutS2, partial [Chloroflexota bacterium]|nr:endonuclease MutS2 [Chloroflexota bacterium]
DVTSEAVAILIDHPDLSVGGARDIRAFLDRATKGSRLQPAELLSILDTLTAVTNFRTTMYRIKDGKARFPRLFEFAEGLANLPGLQATLGRTVSSRGEVLDSASDELGKIRREARVAQSRLSERLNSMVTGKYASAVQDALVTMREGRYVIPVRADAKGQVPGIVHDVSASGQTLFVEPIEVVELNNTLRESQLKEAREIERILDVVTAEVGGNETLLRTSIEALAAFDLSFAKARLAHQMHATRPELATGRNRRIHLIQARHPLIDPKAVVPIDLSLGGDTRALVITGPNTGGKTVALKTVGLLALMHQTGLYIPAAAGSVLPVFDAVFVDIGDEQSIQQSLSTFSSHMTNVIKILRVVGRHDLVLLDEMGAGTDPQEGSALARALLDELLKSRAFVIATTHFTEVKAYASSTEGVENASVEFDLKTLSPTYRLMVGMPGQSNALAIARRLGLPKPIVESARALLDPEAVRTEQFLSEIRTRRTEAERALARAREAEAEAKQLRRLAHDALREAEDARRVAREEALAAAEEDLASIRDLSRRLERQQSVVVRDREEIESRRREIEEAQKNVREFRRTHLAPVRLPESVEIEPGDRVRVVAFDEEGEVLAVEDGSADVQMGAIKIRQPLDGLKRLGRAATAATTERRVTKAALAPAVPIEIDFRGYRAHEIADELLPYLEQAYRSGAPFVRIIHGKGTGALRQVVQDLLKAAPEVQRYELAGPNEGGDGATVAFLQER